MIQIKTVNRGVRIERTHTEKSCKLFPKKGPADIPKFSAKNLMAGFCSFSIPRLYINI